MNTAAFKQSANAAIAEANAERSALVRSQAALFVRGDPNFDPRYLRQMGRIGIAAFLTTVRQRGVRYTQQPTSVGSKQQSTPSPISPGWEKQRCAEPMWWLRAIAWGVGVGLVPIALGAATFLLLSLFSIHY
jgi:hypothetical protein